MRARILAVAVLVGIAGLATLTVRGAAPMGVCCVEDHSCCEGGHACCAKAKTDNISADKQWSVVTFNETIRVAGRFVYGPVLIVHDNQKMAKGEPCTTFYRFDPARGPREELLSFHCRPVQRDVAAVHTLVLADAPEGGCRRLIEYQIAGDSEAHGVPEK